MIAVAPRSIGPSICVYDYPSLDHMYSLEGGAKLDFADIAFSSDGARVAAISKLPDFFLVVWDTATKQVVCRAKMPEPCNSVSFNPLRDDQLCTSGDKGLFIWNIKTSTNGQSLASAKLMIRAVDGEDDEDEDLESDMEDEDFEEAQGPRNDFVCHCWNVNGNVHAATRSGEAYTVTGTGATAIETFPAFYAHSDPGADIAQNAMMARPGSHRRTSLSQITHCCCALRWTCAMDCAVLV